MAVKLSDLPGKSGPDEAAGERGSTNPVDGDSLYNQATIH